jgi:murein DD-endopeptidase MepM/ murein hydrolase activator NlpD
MDRWNRLRGPVLRGATVVAILTLSTYLLARQEIAANGAAIKQKAESPRIHDLAAIDATIPEGDLLTTRTFSQHRPYLTHTIKPGESLRQVASTYNTLPTLLVLLNKGADTRPLPVGGTLLVIPQTDVLPYKVEAGDTVEGVAARYEIPQQDVTRIRDGVLQVGEEIYLCGAKPLEARPRVEVASREAEVRREGPAAPAVRAPAPITDGAWIWPVQVPILEYSEFGPRPEMGDFHTGLDMAADEGSPVVAAHSGRVVTVRWNHPSYGNYVLIDHGNGVQTRYAHAEDLYVTEGQQVSKGTVIMAMGHTGRATGPHLHFEVIVNGTPVNPRSYLP